MSNPSFTFPPPPPPPPRRDTGPIFQQSDYPYQQSGRGRGFGSTPVANRGGFSRPYARGRASRAGSETSRRGYGGVVQNSGLNGNAWQQNNSSKQNWNSGITSNWNEATRGGTTASHGYHHNGPNGGHFDSLYRPPPPDRPPNPSPASAAGNGPARKRPHGQAFGKPQHHGPRPQAAPTIPSFNAGLLLPSSPPKATPAPPAEKAKKTRKHNMLGLTPASVDHESSSDDENEEAKLAASTSTLGLQFEYKGQTATLKTAAEIAAWLVERKKRYPTVAKADAAKKEAAQKKAKWAEEKRRQQEEFRAKKEQQQKQRREAEELRKKALASKKGKSDAKEDEKALKAKLKADKLKIKALKAEMQLKKLQMAARKLEDKTDAANDGDSTKLPPPLDDRLVSHADQVDKQRIDVAAEQGQEEVVSDSSATSSVLSDSSSSLSDSDSTSSSGSSSDAPEQTTTNRTGPIRVPAPPRRQAICRHFAKTGQCRYGNECKHSHDVSKVQQRSPEGKRAKDAPVKIKERRKGLYQVMVEKEQEEEAGQVLKGIVGMGERGMLDPDKKQGC